MSSEYTKKLGLTPKEEALMVASKQAKLFIGLPKERSFQDQRIALTPDAVNALVLQGHKILIEHDAGKECGFSDYLYSEAGAEITKNTEEVFKADVIIKVAPPTLFELELLQLNQTIISPIHLPTITKEYLYYLMKKRCTAIAYEFIKDDIGNYPVVRAMSEIAGASVTLIAAELMSNANNGNGILLGGISGVPPAKVVILGAGVVGTYAAKAALGLGAQIAVFDNDVYKLLNLQNKIGQRVFTSTFNKQILEKELADAEVAIGAVHSTKGITPLLVTEEMVMQMKKGSVIIDVSIDQGGCFDTSRLTTHEHPTFIKHDVIHYCVPNIPSRTAKTSSVALSHILSPILTEAFEMGGFKNLLHSNSGVCSGVYTFNGHLTQSHLAKKFSIKYTDLDLVFSAGI
ncbi:MAG: alanine dehydrogenase [Chitinophagales bacterium]